MFCVENTDFLSLILHKFVPNFPSVLVYVSATVHKRGLLVKGKVNRVFEVLTNKD